MQIEIYTPTSGQPLPPVEWNYTELKEQLTTALEKYKGIVYTEDMISQAKKDRAMLNKLADAIDAKRKEMKALYLHPYERFEAEAKELVGLVKAQSSEIDVQVKTFDEERKRKREEMIREYYAEKIGDLAGLVPYERLHDPKWLNVTVSIENAKKTLDEKIERITENLTSIDALGLDAEMSGAVKDVFLRTLNIAEALAEKARIEKRREDLRRYEEAQAAKKAQAAQADMRPTPAVSEPEPRREAEKIDTGVNTPQQENAPLCVDFRVYATSEQLAKLKAFLVENGIRYGRVPNGQ